MLYQPLCAFSFISSRLKSYTKIWKFGVCRALGSHKPRERENSAPSTNAAISDGDTDGPARAAHAAHAAHAITSAAAHAITSARNHVGTFAHDGPHPRLSW